jgi:hypothetical protein
MGTVHSNQCGPCVLFEKAVALLIAGVGDGRHPAGEPANGPTK